MTQINGDLGKSKPLSAAQSENISKQYSVRQEEVGFFESFFTKEEEQTEEKKTEKHLGKLAELDKEYQDYNKKVAKEEKMAQIKQKLNSVQSLNPKEQAELQAQQFALQADLDQLG